MNLFYKFEERAIKHLAIFYLDDTFYYRTNSLETVPLKHIKETEVRVSLRRKG
jgi:hypothetical protein